MKDREIFSNAMTDGQIGDVASANPNHEGVVEWLMPGEISPSGGHVVPKPDGVKPADKLEHREVFQEFY